MKDFRFHTGDVLPELKLHYLTIGAERSELVRERMTPTRLSYGPTAIEALDLYPAKT